MSPSAWIVLGIVASVAVVCGACVLNRWLIRRDERRAAEARAKVEVDQQSSRYFQEELEQARKQGGGEALRDLQNEVRRGRTE